jgi:SWIRM-associated domain at the N-terminal
MTELNDKERAMVVRLQKYLNDAKFISTFSDVSSALASSKSTPQSCKLDATSVAKICWEILNFMESALGKHSPVTTRETMVKIPMKLFLDRSSDGSLFSILTIVLAYKETVGWDDFNLSLPERNIDGLAILQSIQSSLLEV